MQTIVQQSIYEEERSYLQIMAGVATALFVLILVLSAAFLWVIRKIRTEVSELRVLKYQTTPSQGL